MQPKVVGLGWVLKLLMYMWYRTLLLFSHTVFFLQIVERQTSVSSTSCVVDNTVGNVVASHCQALPPVALFLSQSSWLQSVVFQFVALEFYPKSHSSWKPFSAVLKFITLFFPILMCKLSTVVSEKAGIDSELVTVTLLFGKKVDINEVAIKNIFCFADNS